MSMEQRRAVLRSDIARTRHDFARRSQALRDEVRLVLLVASAARLATAAFAFIRARRRKS